VYLPAEGMESGAIPVAVNPLTPIKGKLGNLILQATVSFQTKREGD